MSTRLKTSILLGTAGGLLAVGIAGAAFAQGTGGTSVPVVSHTAPATSTPEPVDTPDPAGSAVQEHDSRTQTEVGNTDDGAVNDVQDQVGQVGSSSDDGTVGESGTAHESSADAQDGQTGDVNDQQGPDQQGAGDQGGTGDTHD